MCPGLHSTFDKLSYLFASSTQIHHKEASVKDYHTSVMLLFKQCSLLVYICMVRYSSSLLSTLNLTYSSYVCWSMRKVEDVQCACSYCCYSNASNSESKGKKGAEYDVLNMMYKFFIDAKVISVT